MLAVCLEAERIGTFWDGVVGSFLGWERMGTGRGCGYLGLRVGGGGGRVVVGVFGVWCGWGCG